MLHLVFTKHYILVSLLNISDRYPFAYFDLNMKLKLSAVPVNLNNVNPLTLGLATLFSYLSQNSIEKRASRASALRADGVPHTRGTVLTHPISSPPWIRPERSHS